MIIAAAGKLFLFKKNHNRIECVVGILLFDGISYKKKDFFVNSWMFEFLFKKKYTYLNCILFLIMIFVILEEKISAYASRHFSQDLFLKGLKLKQAKNGPHRPPNIII